MGDPPPRLTIPEFAPTEASENAADTTGTTRRLTIPEFAPTEASHLVVLAPIYPDAASRFLNSRRLKQ